LGGVADHDDLGRAHLGGDDAGDARIGVLRLVEFTARGGVCDLASAGFLDSQCVTHVVDVGRRGDKVRDDRVGPVGALPVANLSSPKGDTAEPRAAYSSTARHGQ
jgi:hypothetical protein